MQWNFLTVELSGSSHFGNVHIISFMEWGPLINGNRKVVCPQSQFLYSEMFLQQYCLLVVIIEVGISFYHGEKHPLYSGITELCVCKATFYTAKLLIAGMPYINHPLSVNFICFTTKIYKSEYYRDSDIIYHNQVPELTIIVEQVQVLKGPQLLIRVRLTIIDRK